MLVLTPHSCLNVTKKSSVEHLFKLLSFLEENHQEPNRLWLYNINQKILASNMDTLIRDFSFSYKGVKIISHSQANTLAILGLLYSLYIHLSQVSQANIKSVGQTITHLSNLIKSLSISWIPFYSVNKKKYIYQALDHLEIRTCKLSWLSRASKPLVINLSNLSSSFYLAHYLPYCNFINMYNIKKKKQLTHLLYHEIGHLLLTKAATPLAPIPNEYCSLTKFGSLEGSSHALTEHFCDNFSCYMRDQLTDKDISSFFSTYICQICGEVGEVNEQLDKK